MIVGQVVDAATGDPVGEAIVRLTLPKYFENPATPRGRVMADGEGRFFFTDLPPGEYFLQATKEGYAPGMYGQRRAWGQNILLSLGEGERPTDITIKMWKHGVIAGTVVDEAGEPVAGVAVRAVMKDVFAGRPRYGNMQVASELVPTATTDDRGMFRLSQLMPGTYVVLVPSPQTTVPAAFLERLDTTVRSDLHFAVGAGDLSDLVVALRPALRVEGRMEYRGRSTPQPAAGITFETPFGEPGQFFVQATKGGAATSAIRAQAGSIDVLVNNASIERTGSIEGLAFDDFKATMEMNYSSKRRPATGASAAATRAGG